MPTANMTMSAPEEAEKTGPQETDGVAPESSADPAVALEQEIKDLKDQLLRRRAEFDNYRRRVERDQRAAADDAVVSLLADLLPSFDALEKAVAAKGTLEEIRAGVEITLKDVATTLSGRGVRLEDPTGEKFDPVRHQALSYEPVPGAEDGTVAACYRKGYIMGDRLIRPALVKVAQQATDDPPPVLVPESN